MAAKAPSSVSAAASCQAFCVAAASTATFFILGLNQTAFYPSLLDPANSLTIRNASSSRYTLAAMTWVALAVPVILAYVAYVWRLMNSRPLSSDDMKKDPHHIY